jgi:hypothetical protein
MLEGPQPIRLADLRDIRPQPNGTPGSRSRVQLRRRAPTERAPHRNQRQRRRRGGLADPAIETAAPPLKLLRNEGAPRLRPPSTLGSRSLRALRPRLVH